MSNVPVLELVSERPGRPLVLLHGWGCDARYWDRLIPKLELRGYEVWIAAAPGYTKDSTSVPKSEDYFAVAADRLGSELYRRFTNPVDVVAHSMGVYIACVVASTQPQVLNSLTMLSIVPDPPPQKNSNPAVNELLSTGYLSYDTAQRCVTNWYGGEALDPEQQNEFVSALQQMPVETLLASAEACTLGLDAGVLDSVQSKIRVIVGTNDKARSVDDIKAYVASQPDREVRFIDNAGHMPHWSHPNDLADAMHAYIEKSAVSLNGSHS